MGIFGPSEKELKPHRKLVIQCRDSLRKVLKESNELNRLNWFWKSKEYQDSLDKVKSKFEAWEDILKYQNDYFKIRVKQVLEIELLEIESW